MSRFLFLGSRSKHSSDPRRLWSVWTALFGADEMPCLTNVLYGWIEWLIRVSLGRVMGPNPWAQFVSLLCLIHESMSLFRSYSSFSLRLISSNRFEGLSVFLPSISGFSRSRLPTDRQWLRKSNNSSHFGKQIKLCDRNFREEKEIHLKERQWYQSYSACFVCLLFSIMFCAWFASIQDFPSSGMMRMHIRILFSTHAASRTFEPRLLH